MKPHVICHMTASIDGKTLLSRWKPEGRVAAGLFERLHDELDGDAWLVGRVTGQEFAKGNAYSASASERFPRQAWFARRDAKAYGVVLDAEGKIVWGRADIGGDPLVVVLTEQVADAHLAGLRSEGVSYFFAGKTDIDLGLTLEILKRELGVKRLSWKAAAFPTVPSCAPGWSMKSAWSCVRPSMGQTARPASSIRWSETRGNRRRSDRSRSRAISFSRAGPSGFATSCKTAERGWHDRLWKRMNCERSPRPMTCTSRHSGRMG
jgi:riboflavin biosynthesis pyrimidine reductase